MHETSIVDLLRTAEGSVWPMVHERPALLVELLVATHSADTAIRDKALRVLESQVLSSKEASFESANLRAHPEALDALLACLTQDDERIVRPAAAILGEVVALEPSFADRVLTTARTLTLRWCANVPMTGVIDRLMGIAFVIKMAPSIAEIEANSHEDWAPKKGLLDDDPLRHELDIRSEPRNITLYEKLFEAHRRRGNIDEAYVVAALLDALSARPNPSWLAYRHAVSRVPPIATSLAEEDWKLLRDTNETAAVRAVLAVLAPVGSRLRFEGMRKTGETPPPDPRFVHQEASDPAFAEARARAALYLGFPGEAPSASAAPSASLLFVAAKQATYRRPEHVYGFATPAPHDLTVLFLSGVASVLPEAEPHMPPLLAPEVRALAHVIRTRISDAERAALSDAAKTWFKNGAMLNVPRWFAAAEHTSIRAGLLLIDDPKMVIRILEAGPKEQAGLDVATRVDAALVFAVSKEHFVLRKRLGLAVSRVEERRTDLTDFLEKLPERLAAATGGDDIRAIVKSAPAELTSAERTSPSGMLTMKITFESTDGSALMTAWHLTNTYAFSGDVHQRSWTVQLFSEDLPDPYGKRISTSRIQFGKWEVRPSLAGRPQGDSPGVSAGASPAYDLLKYPTRIVSIEIVELEG